MAGSNKIVLPTKLIKTKINGWLLNTLLNKGNIKGKLNRNKKNHKKENKEIIKRMMIGKRYFF